MSILDDILSVANPAPRLKEPTDFDEFERPSFLSSEAQLESNASASNPILLDSLLNDSRYAGRRVSKRKFDSESSESSNAESHESDDETSDRDSEGEAIQSDTDAAHSKSISDSEQEENLIIQPSKAEPTQNLDEETFKISNRLKTTKSSSANEDNVTQISEMETSLPIEPTLPSSSNITLLGTSSVGKHAEALAVARQTQLLDALLELRIRFQSAMPLINQLPLPSASVSRLQTSFSSSPDVPAEGGDVEMISTAPPVCISFEDFERLSRPDSTAEFNFATSRAQAQAKLVGLIKSLTELQSKLVECTSSKHPDAPRLEFQSPNLAMTPEHQTPINVEHAKSTIMQALQQNHERLQRFRNTILEQWHERTRVQTGAFGPGARGRGRNSRDVPDRAASGAGGFASFESSRTPVELIEHSLQLDRERLLARTRTNRSGTRILGLSLASGQTGGADSLRKSQQQAPYEAACEIFDDEDFYHQQLRELIHRRTAGVTDPLQITQKWLQFQLQHEQGQRVKPSVDTRASKGRKLRYTIHQKLVNFMAPNESGIWDEDRRKVLFASLFDKRRTAVADSVAPNKS